MLTCDRSNVIILVSFHLNLQIFSYLINCFSWTNTYKHSGFLCISFVVLEQISCEQWIIMNAEMVDGALNLLQCWLGAEELWHRCCLVVRMSFVEWEMTKGSEPVRLSPESHWMIPPRLLFLYISLWKGWIRNKNFKYSSFFFLALYILCFCTHSSSVATHCCQKHHWTVSSTVKLMKLWSWWNRAIMKQTWGVIPSQQFN